MRCTNLWKLPIIFQICNPGQFPCTSCKKKLDKYKGHLLRHIATKHEEKREPKSISTEEISSLLTDDTSSAPPLLSGH